MPVQSTCHFGRLLVGFCRTSLAILDPPNIEICEGQNFKHYGLILKRSMYFLQDIQFNKNYNEM